MQIKFTAQAINVSISDDNGNELFGYETADYKVRIDASMAIKHAGTIGRLIFDLKREISKIERDASRADDVQHAADEAMRAAMR
jgi:hypothetical protein